jgi:predicted nucleic-acid-binding protein
MIGLDTNIIIRYLVEDSPAESKKAVEFIEKECTAESPGFLNRIVLCEMVWVLESDYEYTKDEILAVLDALFRIRQLRIDDLSAAWAALEEFRKGDADFSAYLMAATNLDRGCSSTVTFDRKAAKVAGFTSLA